MIAAVTLSLLTCPVLCEVVTSAANSRAGNRWGVGPPQGGPFGFADEDISQVFIGPGGRVYRRRTAGNAGGARQEQRPPNPQVRHCHAEVARHA